MARDLSPIPDVRRLTAHFPARAAAGLLIGCLLFGFISPALAAQTSLRAQDGEIDVSDSNIATGNFGARRNTISGWRNWQNANTSEIVALSASDNNRYYTRDPGRGDNAAMLFELTFDDDRSALSQIDIEIELAQAYNEDALFLYLWDYDAGRYDVLGSYSGTSDSLRSFRLTNSPARYLSPSGQLTLFLVNQDNYGYLAYIRVDYLNVELTAATPHFSISHGGNGSTCDRAEIMIQKHDRDDALDTGFAGRIEVATSTGEGTWSLVTGNGSLEDEGGGVAAYRFDPSDRGTVVLGLAHPTAATVDIDVSDGTETEASTEDPDLVFVDPGVNSVRDEFNALSYSGNDGSQNWAGDWLEVGESNGVNVRYTSVTNSSRCDSGRCLRIGTISSRRQSFTNRGARREVNLSGATSARLSFSYMRRYRRGSGVATVSISDDGGASFTDIASYPLTGNTTSSVFQSFDISEFISANTQIRILISITNARTAIYLDNIEVRYETACPAGGSLLIDHDGTGVHCLDESFRVSARDAGNNPMPSYSQTVMLTTQTGIGTFSSSPSNRGIFDDGTPNDGLASYAFSPDDGGVARFSLNYSGGAGAGSTTTIDLDAVETTNNSVQDDDSEGLLRFAPSAFLLTSSTLSNPLPIPVDDPIGPRIAGTAFRVFLTAFGTTSTNPTCGVIESYEGSKVLDFWSTYADPTSGSRALMIDNTPIGPDALRATPMNVEFSRGRAVVAAQYKDVGRIQIHARDPSVSEPVGGITGSSDAFVSKPADFEIHAVTRPDGSSNPGATTPGGDVFVAAGEPFLATVHVLDAEGDLTPNFGRESQPEGLRLQSGALVAPGGGRNGSLDTGAIGNADLFSADAGMGAFSGSVFSFDEVGAIRLQARVADGDYLGAGDLVSSTSVLVGRFTPSRFEIVPNTPSFEAGCALGAFTWMGQPFHFAAGAAPSLQVRAVNAAGQTTRNYSGDWWRITEASLENRAYAIGSGSLETSGLPATSLDPAITPSGAGQGTLVFSSGSGLIVRRETPSAPFEAEIELSIDVLDLDGVAYPSNPFRFGGTGSGSGIAFSGSKRFQFGRLRFDNAFGSELIDLPMRLRTQQFDGSVFIDDDSDSCSSIRESDLNLVATPGSLSTTPTIGNQPLLSGNADLRLGAPSATGSVRLRVDLGPGGADLPWLRFDWPEDGNLDGSYDDDPSATATFGIWEGRPNTIYRREVY